MKVQVKLESHAQDFNSGEVAIDQSSPLTARLPHQHEGLSNYGDQLKGRR